MMTTYCLSCGTHNDNIGSKKVIMTNKVIRQVSKCAHCVAETSRFLKEKSKKDVLILNFPYIKDKPL